MKLIFFFIIVWSNSIDSIAQIFDKISFVTHRKKIELQIRVDLNEKLNKNNHLKIIPLPLYEIKANWLGKISLMLDTVNCVGILSKDNELIGFVFKESDTPYKLSFFEKQRNTTIENRSVIDTMMIANKKMAIDVSLLSNRLKIIDPDTVDIMLGKGFSFDEKLSMALAYSDSIFLIYSFSPALYLGIGAKQGNSVSYLKFTYPTYEVFNDKKTFFQSHYQTMKTYRRLKKYWNKK